MKDYVFNPKKKDQNVLNSLNILIYDYMMKMKFDKSAKIFASEAYLEDVKYSEGPPSLAQWYTAFHEISNVRCGISSHPGDLARIEGIMLKLENEKKRYQQMGRMDMPYFNMPRDPNEMYKSPNMYYSPQFYPDHQVIDPRKQPDVRNMPPPPRQRYEDPIMPKRFDDPSVKQGMGRFDDPIANKGMGRFDDPINPKGMGRFDDPINPKGMGRFDDPIANKGMGRFDPNSVPISPKIFANSSDPVLFNDKNFFVRDVSTFKMSDKNILFSVLSKEHNILFNVYENRTIGSFNCNTIKNECIVETNGKQITQMRVKDNIDFVWIVATFDTNELMVIRYLVNDIKFEMAGYLRGHSEKIACFDVSDFIYSLDVSGIFRKWNFKGVCEREEVFSGNIHKLFAFAENCLILSDANRTYLYDYEMNMEMSEISRGALISLKKQDNLHLLIFSDKVAIYDKGLNKIKVLSVPNNNIKTAALVDSDIIIGSSQVLWYETQGRLNKCTVYDNNEIVSIESISKYKLGHMVVLSSNGECKIMSKSFNE